MVHMALKRLDESASICSAGTSRSATSALLPQTTVGMAPHTLWTATGGGVIKNGILRVSWKEKKGRAWMEVSTE